MAMKAKKIIDLHKGKTMSEIESTELNNNSPWVQSVLKELGDASPKFQSKSQAIDALNSELTFLAKSRSMSVSDLLKLASSSAENHDDLDRSLRISSLLYSLKNS